MFGLIAISRPKKSFKISNRCMIKNKTAMKLLLLATIKLFLLSILNVFYLYLKISMVVKSIFLFWIFPIRHLPTIITSLTLWPGGGGGGGLPGSWVLLGAPGPIMIVTRRTNLNNIIRADKYIQPQLQLLRAHHPFLSWSLIKMNLSLHNTTTAKTWLKQML